MPDPAPRAEGVDSRPISPEASADPLPSSGSLGDAALSASLWCFAQVVVLKIVTLTGTLALMHLLAPDMIGVASLAVSFASVATVLQPLAMGDVLLAQSRDLARLAGTARRISLATSLGCVA